MDKRYLELMSEKYKNKKEVINEIINLNIQLALPKGTEFFFSDIHGEHTSFLHLLRSASGIIKDKIDILYKDELSEIDRQKLAHLIYYPVEQLENIETSDEWYEETIYRLINVAKFVSTKYTRSSVKRKLPVEYAAAIMEMLNANNDEYIHDYYHDIIQSIISIGNARHFLIALCYSIRKICIDYIHISGDIFDRGPRPDLILDELMKHDNVDFQWGNHDISWMGAASGNDALIANVIRIALSYNCFDLLEDGYGINLRPLSDFARSVYKDDPCSQFIPALLDENKYDVVEKNLTAKMHKAIAIIQLKLEGQLIEKHEEYDMNHLSWLKQINFDDYTVSYLGKTYSLNDRIFPTIDINDPLKLTAEEVQLMSTLHASFMRSYKLQEHISFIYNNGNMYKTFNGNLLFHGCIPLNKDGSFREIEVHNKKLYGKALMDEYERIANSAYFEHKHVDDMWYMWCSKNSPVFGKSKVSVFEKYFIDDKSIQKEVYDYYYQWTNNEDTIKMILKHFNLNEDTGHIINGHVPVKVKDGEKPIKANGRYIVIDGGISKAYQKRTGNAGYTLIYDSQYLKLASHRPYDIEAQRGLLCLTPNVDIIETSMRLKNKDCDIGEELSSQIKDLQYLLEAYKKGYIKERK